VEGKRQFPSRFHDLSRVKVLSETLARRVTFCGMNSSLIATMAVMSWQTQKILAKPLSRSLNLLVRLSPPLTVPASSLPNLAEDGLATVDMSTFTIARIYAERSGTSGVECWSELEPLWLPAGLVGEAQMGLVQIGMHEKKRRRDERVRTLRKQIGEGMEKETGGNAKAKVFRNVKRVERATQSLFRPLYRLSSI